jgi:hypothetical protein
MNIYYNIKIIIVNIIASHHFLFFIGNKGVKSIFFKLLHWITFKFDYVYLFLELDLLFLVCWNDNCLLKDFV